MDENEFAELEAEIQSLVEKRGATDKYYVQVIVSDGVNSFRSLLSNLAITDFIGYGKFFSSESENLLLGFRQWLLK